MASHFVLQNLSTYIIHGAVDDDCHYDNDDGDDNYDSDANYGYDQDYEC